MVDAERVRRRLAELDRRLAALRRLHDLGRERYLAEPDVRTLAERHLQIALQAALDVALHIAAEDAGRTAEDYGDAFALLGELGVLTPDLAQRLRSAAGMRNVLVHGYAELDATLVWAALGDLGDLDDFAQQANAALDRDESSGPA